ncbi:MAG TPA: hypothetical protein VE642_01335 [Pyrinomonadaceae bacterium]|jgi:hypothetical protein|nr:hypothetical protein [Pyrinomonadaceae bacterium]
MIEVSDELLESKRQEAMGHAAFTPDALLDAIQSGGLPEFEKLPPRWRTLVGYHITAKEKALRLKAESLKGAA